MNIEIIENAQPLTSGFTQAGVYARRQFCANLEVCRPPEPLWNPRLREAATTLTASGGRCVRSDKRSGKRKQQIKSYVDTEK